MNEKTISMCQGKGSLAHNNRTFTAKNIDQSRTENNIIFVREDLKTAYEKLFGDAVSQYNAHQKRSDRKIPDYFEHLFNRQPTANVIIGANKQKSFYEDLVQIGTKDDTGVGSADAETAIEYRRPATLSREKLKQEAQKISELEQLRSKYKKAMEFIQVSGLQLEYERYQQNHLKRKSTLE